MEVLVSFGTCFEITFVLEIVFGLGFDPKDDDNGAMVL